MAKADLPVVLIPGFMLDATLWDDFVNSAHQGRTFLRVSLEPGESIKEMATHRVANLPERFILAGFSLGGYVARAIVEQCPERVAGLILIATSLRPDTPAQIRNKQTARQVTVSGGFKGLSAGTIASSLHPAMRGNQALINKIREMGVALGGDNFRIQSSLVRNDITVHPITCPTLVIASREDPLRTIDESREILEEIDGAQLKIIEACGHMIPLEQPRLLARAVDDWLGETFAGERS